MKKILGIAIGIISFSLLSGCSVYQSVFGDDAPKPAPLVHFTPSLQVKQQWSTSVGNGVDDQYLNLQPALNNGTIYAASNNGVVKAVNQTNGDTQWKVDTHYALTSGLGLNDNALFVGGANGEVIALARDNGKMLWVSRIKGEVLAAPVAANNLVLVKGEDGVLNALDANTGSRVWGYPQANPNLILRASSAPVVMNNKAIAGFANGTLIALNINTGQPIWQTQVATPQGFSSVEQMVDIAGTPQIAGNMIYVATYQGQIAALDANSGRILWQRSFSAYTDLAVGSDTVYAADMDGHISAFNRATGALLWKQDALTRHYVTAPVLMGDSIVVGDVEGYLHWLARNSGNFVARTKVDSSGITAKPIVLQNWLYTYTNKGNLAAYTLQ